GAWDSAMPASRPRPIAPGVVARSRPASASRRGLRPRRPRVPQDAGPEQAAKPGPRGVRPQGLPWSWATTPARVPSPRRLEALVALGVLADAAPAVAHRSEPDVRPVPRLVGVVRTARVARGAQGHDPSALLPVAQIEDVASHRGRGDRVPGGGDEGAGLHGFSVSR